MDLTCIVGSSVASILVTTTGALTIFKNGTTPSTSLSNSWFPKVWKKEKKQITIIRSMISLRGQIIKKNYQSLSPFFDELSLIIFPQDIVIVINAIDVSFFETRSSFHRLPPRKSHPFISRAYDGIFMMEIDLILHRNLLLSLSLIHSLAHFIDRNSDGISFGSRTRRAIVRNDRLLTR